ncbi:TetR/AcrR family transcriptional regulator [Myceligenerans pegani]|uniref:TetR/AcrR family transcriptional regulator n=1 Tax=Myceligenerans pegani TaxID=2776917 RepID=A0ABR9N200_9MICO|nr:TetR/AcrR family transcriptional regulator [Myceligenerans sp. TRM 65318]MBE1877680.1 TetR/AcrR family transcriptional regulator [Myceligenerans sp. TRM 65318]MBE3019951.1 TetR/AcrR family transcriptional regulator [Myceligenerans sp. TRM 65318]
MTTHPPAVTAVRPSAARDRLLRTASELFYAEGVRGVGVEKVVAEASVTRATFYRHFAGKEALVVAYIEATDAALRERAGEPPRTREDAGAWLTTVTDLVAETLCAPGFRGCAFINAAAEYPDPSSPVRRAVRAHRDWLLGVVTDALRGAGHPRPDRAGRRWMALRDGAMVGGYLGDPTEARDTLRAGVRDLLSEAV